MLAIALWAWVMTTTGMTVVVIDDFYDTVDRCYWAGSKSTEVWESLGKRAGYVCISH